MLKGTQIAKRALGRRACSRTSSARSSGRRATRYIKDTIKPSQLAVRVPAERAAVQALKNKQIDGLVVDLPTAFYVTAVQVPNSTILGQFPAHDRR